jgi:hypothetical protein
MRPNEARTASNKEVHSATLTKAEAGWQPCRFFWTPLILGLWRVPVYVARVQTISLQVPDSLLAQAGGSREQLSEQAQVLLAVKYFELGVLNFGQAAAMCSMERADFLSIAKRYGVPVGDWQGL